MLRKLEQKSFKKLGERILEKNFEHGVSFA